MLWQDSTSESVEDLMSEIIELKYIEEFYYTMEVIFLFHVSREVFEQGHLVQPQDLEFPTFINFPCTTL